MKLNGPNGNMKMRERANGGRIEPPGLMEKVINRSIRFPIWNAKMIAINWCQLNGQMAMKWQWRKNWIWVATATRSWRKSSRIKKPGTWTCQECVSELKRPIQLYDVNCEWIISNEDNAKITELRQQLRQEKGAAIWAVKKFNKWQRERNLRTWWVSIWYKEVGLCNKLMQMVRQSGKLPWQIAFFVWNALILNFPGVCQLTRSIDRERERGSLRQRISLNM